MPLSFADIGSTYLIKEVTGKEETKQHLENLGFVPGAHVSVVSDINGNLILNIKDSRVALSREMAAKIMI